LAADRRSIPGQGTRVCGPLARPGTPGAAAVLPSVQSAGRPGAEGWQRFVATGAARHRSPAGRRDEESCRSTDSAWASVAEYTADAACPDTSLGSGPSGGSDAAG